MPHEEVSLAAGDVLEADMEESLAPMSAAAALGEYSLAPLCLRITSLMHSRNSALCSAGSLLDVCIRCAHALNSLSAVSEPLVSLRVSKNHLRRERAVNQSSHAFHALHNALGLCRS